MGLPSTVMRAFLGSTLVPSSVTSLPLTRTLPAVITFSASRREATPAAAKIFCKRSSIKINSLNFKVAYYSSKRVC